MAEKSVCKVDGCGKRARSSGKGYCSMHETRLARHGDLTRGYVSKRRQFLEGHKDYRGDDCLLWPFAINSTGYGAYVSNGVSTPAHRAMCIIAHGPPTLKTPHAAHSCGNRACVNPRHLRWASPKQNEKDKLRHGTHLRKTTQEQELQIIQLKGRLSQRKIGKMFGISHTVVGEIHNSKRHWPSEAK